MELSNNILHERACNIPAVHTNTENNQHVLIVNEHTFILASISFSSSWCCLCKSSDWLNYNERKQWIRFLLTGNLPAHCFVCLKRGTILLYDSLVDVASCFHACQWITYIKVNSKGKSCRVDGSSHDAPALAPSNLLGSSDLQRGPAVHLFHFEVHPDVYAS